MSDIDQNDGPGPVVSVRIGAKGYTADVRAAGHDFKADEPTSLGGADEGPDPYALLLSSLGACKAMTMRMYADRKKWPLTGAAVHLRHSRVHATDCDDCETKEGKIDRIECRIELRGDLTDEQSKRIIEIADRCPVHRTITSEIDIVTTGATLGP